MQEVLNVVLVPKGQRLDAFATVCQRMHSPAKAAHHNLKEFFHSGGFAGMLHGSSYFVAKLWGWRRALRENSAEAEVAEPVLLKDRLYAGALRFPLLQRFWIFWRKIHEFFEQVSQHRKTVDVWILAGSKEPSFPLRAVRQCWWLAGGAGRQEEFIQRWM